ncbi:hypothetical protein PtB15_13B168 [Puccinia triticina]|nr:hypothetical protein PtB15_13B168 [Puccinia triticina]
MSDNKPPSGRLQPKPRLGAIPGLRTINRSTPKNPTMKTVLGPSNFRGNKGKGPDISDDVPEETTFQPRLTGRVIGSSSQNWRRTESAPHLAEKDAPQPPPPQQLGQSDITSLVEEMRFRRELDSARLEEDRARQEEDRARRLAEENITHWRQELDEQAKISSIVNSAINKLDTEDILKPDGSNVRRWEDALRLTAFERFHDQHFFTPGEDKVVDPYYEAIARGIIHSSVHADLSYDLVDYDNSAAVYEHLLSKF